MLMFRLLSQNQIQMKVDSSNGETLMHQGAGHPSPQAMMLAQFFQGFVHKSIDKQRGPGPRLLHPVLPREAMMVLAL